MTQFVIHVGPHKTGSTYLQGAFALLRPQLAERGIHYPSVWGEEAHHELYDALRTDPNPTLEAQFADLRAAGHATVLISGEGLSVAPPPAVAHLRRLIGPDAPVRVVFYTRAWADLLPSQWKQAVKGGVTTTLPEFLFRRLVNPASQHYVNFGFKLRILAKVFGKDAIRIVAYDQVVAAKQDLFSHFAGAFLGLPDQPAPALPPANVSPSTADIEVIRALAVRESAQRNGPIPTPVAVAMVARYLRRKPTLEMPALNRALAAHQSTLTINETAAELMELHRQLIVEFGQGLVSPRLPKYFFRPRVAEIPFVRPDYLLAADVQRELTDLYQLIRVGKGAPTRAEQAAGAPPAMPAPQRLGQVAAGRVPLPRGPSPS